MHDKYYHKIDEVILKWELIFSNIDLSGSPSHQRDKSQYNPGKIRNVRQAEAYRDQMKQRRVQQQ